MLVILALWGCNGGQTIDGDPLEEVVVAPFRCEEWDLGEGTEKLRLVPAENVADSDEDMWCWNDADALTADQCYPDVAYDEAWWCLIQEGDDPLESCLVGADDCMYEGSDGKMYPHCAIQTPDMPCFDDYTYYAVYWP